MRITDIETVLLTGPCTEDPYIVEGRPLRSAAFIEIHTDTELKGIGETYAGYFCPETVPAIVDFFKPILIGQDCSDIDELWNRMYHCGNFWCRVGLGLIIINGIEAALWDLKGKMEGIPVYELLGGRRHDSLPAYATGGMSNYPKDKLAKKIEFYASLGFNALKLGAGAYIPKSGYYIPMTPTEAADFEGDKAAFVRQHMGKDFRIAMDGHMGNSTGGTWDLEIAKAVMKAVEPYDMFFYEEPLHYTDPWGYSELCNSTSVPIAGGECLTGRYEWKVFADVDAFDIGQPDGAFTGGLLEFTRVADMLERRGRKVATHSWGAGIAFMQNIHCGFACPNTVVLEIAPAFGGLHRDLIDDSFHMEDGMVLPPQKPGLGVALTDDIKNRYPFVPGTGEFNDVPGKLLDVCDAKGLEQIREMKKTNSSIWLAD